jgi:DNA-binding transcriptional MerR regulator
MDNSIFTIGELSHITGVSKQAIRYYDKIGLIQPARVESNAYRYYKPIHILYINSITRLSKLGCSLSEIKAFLTGGCFPDIMNMLQFRRQLSIQKIDELKFSLEAIEQQIEMIEIGVKAKTINEIEIKSLPKRYFVFESVLEGVSVKNAIIKISKLIRKLKEKDFLFVSNPVFQLPENKINMRTGFFMASNPDDTDLEKEILNAGEYACIYHHGNYADMEHTANKLKKYLAENNLNTLSSFYQLFLIDYALTRNDEDLITELQVRIK